MWHCSHQNWKEVSIRDDFTMHRCEVARVVLEQRFVRSFCHCTLGRSDMRWKKEDVIKLIFRD